MASLIEQFSGNVFPGQQILSTTLSNHGLSTLGLVTPWTAPTCATALFNVFWVAFSSSFIYPTVCALLSYIPIVLRIFCSLLIFLNDFPEPLEIFFPLKKTLPFGGTWASTGGRCIFSVAGFVFFNSCWKYFTLWACHNYSRSSSHYMEVVASFFLIAKQQCNKLILVF